MSVNEKILKMPLEKVVGDRFGRYSKYIIQERALPDARDGLKPVQRRSLYAMYEDGNRYDKAYRKSAKSVGAIIGNYHPHGDSSVYEAMVRMAQEWKVRYPLTDMHGNKGSIDGDNPAAFRYCVTGETLVNTDSGLVRMDDIVKDSELNSDNEVDIEVDSIEGRNHASKFFNSGIHETYKVELDKGYNIEGTSNHPVLTIEKSEDGAPRLKWKTIEDLKEEDRVVMNFKEDQVESEHDLVNEEVAALLGIMVSDGWISGKEQKYKRIGLNMKEVEIVDRMKDIMERNFGVNVSVGKSGNTKVITVDNNDLYDKFVEEYGYKFGSYTKTIPDVIMKSSRKIQAIFLSHLYEGDGCTYFNDNGYNSVSYTSYSKELINQLQVILASFGIVSAKYKEREGQRLNLLGRESIDKFRKHIGFVSDQKIGNLNDALDRYEDTGLSKTVYVPFISEYLRNKYNNWWLDTRNFDRKNKFYKNEEKLMEILDSEDFNTLKYWIDSEFVFLPVKNIESNGENVVYSVKVDSECHSFTANGMFNHNTEMRLEKIAQELIGDINKDTVDMVNNFDDTSLEPTVLPAGYPNLLVNGSTGIASGYATNMPPHNMNEIIDATVKRLDSPNCRLDTLLDIVKGPDFPGGGVLQGNDTLRDIYKTGKGKVVLRAKYDIEKKKGRTQVVVTEIPYETNKAKIVESIDVIRLEKKVEGIAGVVDETDKNGIRVVIELKKGSDSDNILAYLFKNTDLEVNYNYNMVAIKDQTPELLDLEGLLDAFIDHKKDVVTRRSEFDLKKAKDRLHIVEGIIKAMSILNKVVKTIRESKNKSDAISGLVSKYKFTEIQATAIVNLQLYRLSNTDVTALEKESEELEKEITRLETILSDEKELVKLVKKELNQVKKEFGDDRRTVIQEEVKELKLDMTAVIPEEDVMIAVSESGYVKRSNLRSFSSSGGEKEVGVSKGDKVLNIFEAKTTQTLLVFTSHGNYVYLPVHEMVEDKWKDVGTHVSHYAPLDGEEVIVSALLVDDMEEDKTILTVKDSGLVKRSALSEHKVQRNSKTVTAIKCKDDEKMLGAWLTDGKNQLVFTTKEGYGIHFEENEVAPKGVKTAGMRGIHLHDGDEVTRVDVVKYKKDVKGLESELGGKVEQKVRGRRGSKLK